jgi:hypothetical protein
MLVASAACLRFLQAGCSGGVRFGSVILATTGVVVAAAAELGGANGRTAVLLKSAAAVASVVAVVIDEWACADIFILLGRRILTWRERKASPREGAFLAWANSSMRVLLAIVIVLLLVRVLVVLVAFE